MHQDTKNKQKAEIQAQSRKLDLIEVDKNICRTPVFRQRSPREMKNRRKPGWTDCRFFLPKLILEGLRHLAKTAADQERRDRSRAAHGFQRRYPRNGMHTFEDNAIREGLQG